MNTESKLSRIFAICNEVAATGKPIRTLNQGRQAGRVFLGLKKSEKRFRQPKRIGYYGGVSTS